MSLPAAEYRSRLAERQARVAACEKRSERISNARLLVFVLGVVLLGLIIGPRWGRPAWLAVPGLVFLSLVVLHDRSIRARKRAERAVAFYERGLARIEDRWIGTGETGERFATPEHPYALDLDLFGKGSLFELLSIARTALGEATLAAWLSGPAPVGELRARQQAIDELRPRLALREELAVLGEDLRAELDGARLIAWGQGSGAPLPGWVRPIAALLALGTCVALGGWAWLDWGPFPFIGLLGLEWGFSRLLGERIAQATHAVDRAGQSLALLTEIVGRVEAEPLADPRGMAIHQALRAGGEPASRRIAQLERLVHLFEARLNQFFSPIAFILLWGAQCAVSIDAWRRICGPELGRWLEAIGDMEALTSLSGYAFEHPEDPFPTLVEDRPTYDAEGLGHPLLPAARCVRNDLALAGERRLLLVSGSNMSGKSTFLRTVGINAVLALAGAPVRATRMTISPLAIGATLRIQDSLQQGASRFYAEITRLRQLMDLASGPLPLLFLLDEILHGTNSHDRLLGAEAVIRALLERGALGLVTTHDLALAQLADSLGARAANAHFADHLEEGKLVFDYRKRDGVVTRSNAIELMRAVGLPL